MRRRHRRRRTCCVRSYPKPPGTRWRPGAGAAPGVAGRGASQSCRRCPPPRQRSSGRPRPRCRRRHGTPPRGERGRWSPRQQRAAHPRSQCRRQSRSWRCRAGSRCRGSRQLRLPPQCTAELRRQCRYARQPLAARRRGSEHRLQGKRVGTFCAYCQETPPASPPPKHAGSPSVKCWESAQMVSLPCCRICAALQPPYAACSSWQDIAEVQSPSSLP